MKNIKLFIAKWAWHYPILYPCITIIIWRYVVAFIYLDFRGFVSNYTILYLYTSQVLFPIVAAIVFFIVNCVEPKATTWHLSFKFALQCMCFYLLYMGIWPFIWDYIINILGYRGGSGEWLGFQRYFFWHVYFPLAVLLFPLVAAAGRLGAYWGSKARRKATSMPQDRDAG